MQVIRGGQNALTLSLRRTAGKCILAHRDHTVDVMRAV